MSPPQKVVVTTTAADFDKWIRPLLLLLSSFLQNPSNCKNNINKKKTLSISEHLSESGAFVKTFFETTASKTKSTFWISFPEYFLRPTLKTIEFPLLFISYHLWLSDFPLLMCQRCCCLCTLYTSVTRYQQPPTRHSYTLLEERRKEEGETDIYDMHLPPPFFGYMCRVYVSPTFCKWISGMVFFRAHVRLNILLFGGKQKCGRKTKLILLFFLFGLSCGRGGSLLLSRLWGSVQEGGFLVCVR